MRENSLLAERHVRYGGIAYHHISDTYIALFSHFIACGVWAAVYIIDGLLKNESDIQPDTVHADTQGQSESVFGLAHLLGIQLMPRMRTWNKVTFYRPDKEEIYEPTFRCEKVRKNSFEVSWKAWMRQHLNMKLNALTI